MKRSALWKSVSCPTCGARLDEPCKTVNPYKLAFGSRRSPNPHAARVWASNAPPDRVDGDTGLRAFVAMKIAQERFDRAEERRREGDALIANLPGVASHPNANSARFVSLGGTARRIANG